MKAFIKTKNLRFSRRLFALLTAILIISGVITAQPQLPVNLGSTNNFVILAGASVSNVPISAVTGNVGLSPAAGSGITGFGAMEITGIVYAVDVSGPAGSTMAPTMLTAAKGDLTTAYNDAAGRTPVPSGSFLDPGTGNIGGLTLIPGLYKFTSTASITGSNVTLSGTATDVWIFQIATALNVGSGIQVILAGSAKASNIFWQVGTSATLGSTSVFKGTILADQSISLNTGAVVEGRLLASAASVTLASSTVTLPAGTTGVEQIAAAPYDFALLQNYPNPFNPATSIAFTVPSNGRATLKVFTMLGQEIATLFDGPAEAGMYNHVQFNASEHASGLYISRLEYNGSVQMKKMVLLK
jgi:hypothetical protein